MFREPCNKECVIELSINQRPRILRTEAESATPLHLEGKFSGRSGPLRSGNHSDKHEAETRHGKSRVKGRWLWLHVATWPMTYVTHIVTRSLGSKDLSQGPCSCQPAFMRVQGERVRICDPQALMSPFERDEHLLNNPLLTSLEGFPFGAKPKGLGLPKHPESLDQGLTSGDEVEGCGDFRFCGKHTGQRSCECGQQHASRFWGRRLRWQKSPEEGP